MVDECRMAFIVSFQRAFVFPEALKQLKQLMMSFEADGMNQVGRNFCGYHQDTLGIATKFKVRLLLPAVTFQHKTEGDLSETLEIFLGW